MQITIFGASGGIGKHVVDLALARGYTVRAIFRKKPTRPATERFEPIVIPDLLADGELTSVVRDSDAIISAIGNRRVQQWNLFSPLASAHDLTSHFARQLVAALHGRGPHRVVVVSAAGVGDSWQSVSPPLRMLFRATNIGVAYDDLDRMEAVFRDSGLDWTCVRPTTLTNGRLTENVRHTNTFGLLGHISRANVAWYLLRSLEQSDTRDRTPMITGS